MRSTAITSAIAAFRADRARYPRTAWLTEPSLWAVAVYRLGAMTLEPDLPLRPAFTAIYAVMFPIIRLLTLIELPRSATIGPWTSHPPPRPGDRQQPDEDRLWLHATTGGRAGSRRRPGVGSADRRRRHLRRALDGDRLHQNRQLRDDRSDDACHDRRPGRRPRRRDPSPSPPISRRDPRTMQLGCVHTLLEWPSHEAVGYYHAMSQLHNGVSIPRRPTL
jgi:hypothetical protein